jgi:hypothetical protein
VFVRDSELVSSYGKYWDLHENAEVGWWGSSIND